jgi:hypothetical protein
MRTIERGRGKTCALKTVTYLLCRSFVHLCAWANESAAAKFRVVDRRKRLAICLPLFGLALCMCDESAHAATFTTFDPPGSIATFPYSINTVGAITGNYFEASGVAHGFVRDPSGGIQSDRSNG